MLQQRSAAAESPAIQEKRIIMAKPKTTKPKKAKKPYWEQLFDEYYAGYEKEA